MRELDIRTALLARLREEYQSDERTRVLNELAVGGGVARIDVAVVNGRFLGFEIKSDADTLDRLPSQAKVYSDVFDCVTVVCGCRHLSKVEQIVPSWWSIIEAAQSNKQVQFTTIRRGSENPGVNPLQIARLLWRHEAVSIMETYGIAAGLRSKSREYLVRALCKQLEVSVMQSEVRERLKSRLNWRVDEQHALCGDSFRPVAKS